jgi:hypothetical protein
MTPEKIAETAKRIRERIFDRVQDEGAFHASSIERVISDELRLAMVANVPAAVAHREPIDVYGCPTNQRLGRWPVAEAKPVHACRDDEDDCA